MWAWGHLRGAGNLLVEIGDAMREKSGQTTWRGTSEAFVFLGNRGTLRYGRAGNTDHTGIIPFFSHERDGASGGGGVGGVMDPW